MSSERSTSSRSPLSRRLHCPVVTIDTPHCHAGSPPHALASTHLNPGVLRGPHVTTTGHHPTPPPRAELVPASHAGQLPSPTGTALQAALPVGSEPRPVGATSTSSPHQAPPRPPLVPPVVRPKREPRGASLVQPRRLTGQRTAKRAAPTVPPSASPRTRLARLRRARWPPPSRCLRSAGFVPLILHQLITPRAPQLVLTVIIRP